MAASKSQNAVEKMASRYYPTLWSIDALKALVAAGKLTKSAYARITGDDLRTTA